MVASHLVEMTAIKGEATLFAYALCLERGGFDSVLFLGRGCQRLFCFITSTIPAMWRTTYQKPLHVKVPDAHTATTKTLK